MRRFILSLVIILFASHLSSGQIIKTVNVNGGYYTGLYGSSGWIIKPFYSSDVRDLGYYLGSRYYAFRMEGDFAIFNSKGERLTDFVIPSQNFAGSDRLVSNGMLLCMKGGKYGIYNLSPFFELIPFSYSYITFTLNDEFHTNGGRKLFDLGSLLKTRDEKVKEMAQKDEKERETKRLLAEAAKKKEQLASYTAYAKAYVEPKINEWQQKGEFEKLADYRSRVTGPNRSAMIDRLTAEAEKLYLEENAALHPELMPMAIQQYDSENEVFPVKSEKFGTLLLKVPIDKAPVFKRDFSIMSKENPEFFISSDTLALRSLVFRNPKSGESVVYRNDAALHYQQYDINPETYEFNVVRIVSQGTSQSVSSSESRHEYNPPLVSIISPERHSEYSAESVIIRYSARTFDGSKPAVSIWINGAPAEQVTPLGSSASKGISAGWSEVQVQMPRLKRGETANVSLQVSDGSGAYSEVQRVELKYAGATHKSDLWLFAVGINDYKVPLSPLKQAVQDAQKFVSTVSSSNLDMYGDVHTVLIPQQDATRSRLLSELGNLGRNVSDGSVIMLFFSGHGITDGDEGFFMTYDANPDDPDTGLSTAAINRSLKKLVQDNSCHVVVFMDSCHAGKMGRRGYSTPLTLNTPQIYGFYSSKGSQESQEKDDGGVFTSALVQGLSGAAANADGEVTTETLRNYLRTEVVERTQNRQIPTFDIPDEEVILFKVK